MPRGGSIFESMFGKERPALQRSAGQEVKVLWRNGQLPQLIGGAAVRPLDDGRSIGGAAATDVGSLAAVHVQKPVGSIARRRDRPLLAVVIIRWPDLHDRAIGSGC